MKPTKNLLASLIGLALFSPVHGDEVVNVEESSTSYQYTDDGMLSQVDGPRTDVEDITRFEYLDKFNLHKIINALGHTTIYANYSPLKLAQTIVDSNGVKTTLKYDLGNRVTEATVHSAKGKLTTKLTYDMVGQITLIESPDGSKLKIEYSDARYLMAIENDQGERIEYDYDNAGNRIKTEVKSSSGQIVAQHQQVFDEMSRLLKSVDADGHATQFSYDLNSNITGITNAKEHKTIRQFDVLNRLVKQQDALQQTSEKVYNKFGDVVKVIAPNGATTTFKYDRRHRVIERNSPDSGKTTYAYDAAHNLIQKVDARGIETRYSYDALNRLISQQYPDAPELNISYIYDETANGNKGIGRLTGIQDQSGLVAFSYDDTGNLTSVSRSMTVAGREVVDSTQYQTNLMGYITQVTYPSGAKVDYARNSLGEVTTITYQPSDSSLKPVVIAKDISYQAYGPLTSLTWGNNTQLERTYSQSGRLMSQTVTGVQDLDYTYDPVGNITQINDSNNASYSATYQYDALDRLAQEQGYFGTKKYSFDPVGNRTKREWVTPNTAAEGQPSNSETHTQTLTYKKDSNRLTKVNNQTITTDATGHITENNPLSFTYDARGRIHSISKNGQLQAEYIYNVLGERVLKTRYKGDNKEYSTFHYNTNGQLLVDTLHDQNRKRLSRHYIWLDNMPLAMIEEVYQSNGKIDRHQVNYIHADHLNAPRRASDTKGNTSWAWYRDAYGEGNVNQDVDGDGKKTFIALRFPGQYYDPESGLFYNYQRYYDSSVGRYTTTDPIGLQGGLNTFAYVEGNPVNRVDPFGEVAIAIPVVIVGQLIVDAVAVSIGVYALTNDTPVSSEMAGLQRTRNTVSHAREAEILQGFPGGGCDGLESAIRDLKKTIKWRKGDLNPAEKGTRNYVNHVKRIKILQQRLDLLKREAKNMGCNPDCE